MKRHVLQYLILCLFTIASVSEAVENHRGIILRPLTPPCSGDCTNLYLQSDSASQILYLTGSYLSNEYIGSYVQVTGFPIYCNGCPTFLITQPIVVLSPASVNTIQDLPPTSFLLKQNYPNPFNPATAIEYLIPSEGIIILSVYSALGEKIETLVSRRESAGLHRVEWNGARFPSGLYFAVLSWNPKDGLYLRQATSMLLVK
ncbi:MAG TPA: hypothetical protein VKI62_02860 [Bacteroidota bacterium]|nr:hypothetical protein [Bacteroidota bacterium]